MNTLTFVEKSKIVHKDRYDYSMVNYVNAKSKIEIICKEHGIFNQTPSNHLYMKQGCPYCNSINRSNKNNFIERSSKIHNNKFIYDRVDYKNAYSKIVIICKDHGEFIQIPHNHLRGHGCPKCSENKKLNNEELIEKCKFTHGDNYTYDNIINYVNNKSKITITCKKHGEFIQNINNHLNGQGCPICAYSKGETLINNFLLNNRIKFEKQYMFDNLRDKRPLRFDFCIFNDYSEIKFLIEYNGSQHYKFINFFHRNKENFLSCKKRDKLKREYCSLNNIPLYIIKYTDDINLKLSNIFNFIGN